MLSADRYEMSCQSKRGNLVKFTLFLLYFFLAYIFIYFEWPGDRNIRFDASYYWRIINSLDINDLPKTFRGYLYPYILFALKTFSQYIGIPTERLFILVNAAAVSVLCVIFMPKIIYAGADRCGVRAKRFILGSASFFLLLLFFWEDHIVFPLSDFPALFCCAGMVYCLVSINESISQNRICSANALWLFFLALLAGGFAYASYNTRAVYIYGIVISLIIWILKNRRKRVIFPIFLAMVLGGLLVSYPQMCVNFKYQKTYIPNVPTENFPNTELKKWHLARGLMSAREETYVGNDPVQSARFRAADKTGLAINKKEKISAGLTIGNLITLFCKYPLDITSIYSRHVINDMTIIYRKAYVTDLTVNTVWVVVPGIFLWLIFFYYLCLIDFTEYKTWILDKAWIAAPFIIVCVLMIPAGAQVRFFMAAYCLMYGFLCYRADFMKIWNNFKRHPVLVMSLMMTVFLFWVSVISVTLSLNNDGAALFKYK